MSFIELIKNTILHKKKICAFYQQLNILLNRITLELTLVLINSRDISFVA